MSRICRIHEDFSHKRGASSPLRVYSGAEVTDGSAESRSDRHYLLVSQSMQRIEHYQREASGEWRYRVVEAGGRVTLASGASIDIDTVYDGVLELAGE